MINKQKYGDTLYIIVLKKVNYLQFVKFLEILHILLYHTLLYFVKSKILFHTKKKTLNKSMQNVKKKYYLNAKQTKLKL